MATNDYPQDGRMFLIVLDDFHIRFDASRIVQDEASLAHRFIDRLPPRVGSVMMSGGVLLPARERSCRPPSLSSALLFGELGRELSVASWFIGLRRAMITPGRQPVDEPVRETRFVFTIRLASNRM